LPVDDIVELSGEALITAVDAALDSEPPPSFDDLIKILSCLNSAKPAENQDSDFALMETYHKSFSQACQVGGPEQLDEIVASFLAASPKQGADEMLFDLAPLWLDREFAELEKENSFNLVPDANGISLPDGYRNASEDVRRTCLQFRALISPYQTNYSWNEKRPWISYFPNTDVFWQDAKSILAGNTTKALPRLAMFRWGGSCGTGSEELYNPKSLLIFMALVKEHRFTEAVGAALSLPGWRGLEFHRWTTADQIAIRFLTLCGLDWQAVFCGRLIQVNDRGLDPGFTLSSEGKDEAARILAHALLVDSNCEDRVVQTLVNMLRPPKLPNSESDPDPLPGLLGGEKVPPRSVALADDTREEIIEAFAEWASPESNGYALDSAIPHIASLIRPSTTAALRRMLEHHSSNIVERATGALIARGETVPKAVAAKPVTFHLSLGGRPVNKGSVAVRLQAGRFSRKIDVKPNPQGGITVPGEDFARRHSPVTAIVFETDLGYNEERKLNDPCFQLTVPIRPNQTPPSNIVIPAQPVTIALNLPLQAGRDRNAKLHLRVIGMRNPEDEADALSVEFILPPRPQYFIPAVQEGVYTFQVLAPGAADWSSESISVKGSAKTVSAKLLKGRNVRVRIEMPKDASWPLLFSANDRSGRGVAGIPDESGKTFTYAAIAPGDYTLRIQSSAEEESQILESAQPNEVILKPREEMEWKNVAKKFKITDDSPETIDLGTIRVEALPKRSR